MTDKTQDGGGRPERDKAISAEILRQNSDQLCSQVFHFRSLMVEIIGGDGRPLD